MEIWWHWKLQTRMGQPIFIKCTIWQPFAKVPFKCNNSTAPLACTRLVGNLLQDIGSIQNELHQQQECLSHKVQHHRRVNGDLRSHALRLQYYTTNENTDASRLRNSATDPTTWVIFLSLKASRKSPSTKPANVKKLPKHTGSAVDHRQAVKAVRQ